MTGEIFRKHRVAFVLTFGLFALWGLGHRLYDTLVPEFGKVFSLDSVHLVITQSSYSLTYFLLAIPAAIYTRVFGLKAGLVFGLGCWCVGSFLFYPAAQQHAFVFFLSAAALMACGYIFIEISVNPFVARMGPPESATRRLNFAHALYPLGVLAGLYVGRWVILSNLELPVDRLSNAIVRPYMVLGGIVLLLAFLAENTPFPALATAREGRRGTAAEFRTLLGRPMFVAAVAAQFCNVAAQAGIWTMMVPYVRAMVPGAAEATAADYLLVSLIIFAIGRFAGAFLMFRFQPERLLAAFAASGLVLSTIAVLAGGEIGACAMVASSFSVSIMFATVLGLAIRDLGPLTKTGTALVYVGGAGSGAGVAMMHLVWTVSSIQLSMIVPMFGFAGVLAFALFVRRQPAVADAPAVVHAAE
jgi:FHS family L-fucose permease-like MFS transporter